MFKPILKNDTVHSLFRQLKLFLILTSSNQFANEQILHL
jgi:hypothetical protein